MKTVICSILFLAMLALAGCGGVREVHDDVQAPPATAHTSLATEDLIAQRAAALARVKVDEANARAAKSEAERAIAAAASQKDRADVEALTRAITEQRIAENAARFDRGYWVAGLLFLLAGFLLYERNVLGASRAGLAAVGVIVTVQALSFAATHEGLVLGSAVLIAMGELAWHYRAKLLATEQALIHSVRGYPWADAEKHVQALLFSAWTQSLSALERVEVLLHLKAKAAPAVPPPASPALVIPTTIHP